MKPIILSVLFILLTACSSRSSIKIRSVPEGASVSAVDSDGSTRLIGKTPVESDESLQALLIEKEGYEPARVFVGRLQSQHYEYTVKLDQRTEDPKMADLKTRYERLAKNIAKANNLINNKRYAEADALLSNLTSEYPYVSVGHDLLGNVSYLQKDFKRAIGHYQKSLELNPENIETRQVLDRLRSMSN